MNKLATTIKNLQILKTALRNAERSKVIISKAKLALLIANEKMKNDKESGAKILVPAALIGLASLASLIHVKKEEQRTSVYVLSNSLPIDIEFGKGKNIEEVKKMTTRPGGLGTGVISAFEGNNPYKNEIWIGIDKNRKRLKGIKGERDEFIINSTFQDSINKSLEFYNNMKYLFIEEETKNDFYQKATNGVFWPFHHGLDQHIIKEDLSYVYHKVNKLMADKCIEEITKKNKGIVPNDTLVWVHDYHLQTTPQYLKDRAPKLKVGYVHHIPFREITKEWLEKFPENKQIIKDTLMGVLHADTINFHTENDKKNFIKSIQNSAIITNNNELIKLESKIIVNPIGISKIAVEKNLKSALAMNTFNPFKYVPTSEETLGTTQEFDIIQPRIDEVWNSYLIPKLLNNSSRNTKIIGDVRLDSNKINIGAVSRLDYTKGIHELIDGFHQFLQQKSKIEINTNAGKLYQLNIVASSPRDIPAYLEYQRVANEKIMNVNNEFPGSLAFIPGLDFIDLPIYNAAQDITIAMSVADGYLMAAPEALRARIIGLQTDELIIMSNKASAIIMSKGAGVSKSLEKDANNNINIPQQLSIIKNQPETIKESLLKHVHQIEVKRLQPVDNPDLRSLKELDRRINTTQHSAKKGLDFLKNKSPVSLTLDNGKVIGNPIILKSKMSLSVSSIIDATKNPSRENSKKNKKMMQTRNSKGPRT